jgi:hypothetical protein
MLCAGVLRDIHFSMAIKVLRKKLMYAKRPNAYDICIVNKYQWEEI